MPTWRSTGLPGDRANCLLGLIDNRNKAAVAQGIACDADLEVDRLAGRPG
jgi:hypothetical protein